MKKKMLALILSGTLMVSLFWNVPLVAQAENGQEVVIEELESSLDNGGDDGADEKDNTDEDMSAELDTSESILDEKMDISLDEDGEYSISLADSDSEDGADDVSDDEPNLKPQSLTATVGGETRVSLKEGDTAAITIDSVHGNVTYASDNAAVVSVDDDGVITAKGSGSTTITINASGDNEYQPAKATILVTVEKEGDPSDEAESTSSKKDIGDLSIASIPNQLWIGEEIKPELEISDGSYILKEETDYSLAYSENKDIGTATVNITGIGTGYEGSVTRTFNILGSIKKSDCF